MLSYISAEVNADKSEPFKVFHKKRVVTEISLRPANWVALRRCGAQSSYLMLSLSIINLFPSLPEPTLPWPVVLLCSLCRMHPILRTRLRHEKKVVRDNFVPCKLAFKSPFRVTAVEFAELKQVHEQFLLWPSRNVWSFNFFSYILRTFMKHFMKLVNDWKSISNCTFFNYISFV